MGKSIFKNNAKNFIMSEKNSNKRVVTIGDRLKPKEAVEMKAGNTIDTKDIKK
jgi:hypothetical protein